MNILELKDLWHGYYVHDSILKGIDMIFEEGKMYAILGESGSGKTTLLSLMGGLEAPTKGKILFSGEELDDIGYSNYRRTCVSFVFQNYNLIDYMTPAENVSLATRDDPMPFLEQVGITKEESRRSVLKLSGGQQQRVAIARGLASQSKIILADEPTGNLDENNSREVAKLLLDNAKRLGKCVVVVSHSREVADMADEVYLLKGGLLHKERVINA